MFDNILQSFLNNPEGNQFMLIRNIFFCSLYIGTYFYKSTPVDPADFLVDTFLQTQLLYAFTAQTFGNIPQFGHGQTDTFFHISQQFTVHRFVFVP